MDEQKQREGVERVVSVGDAAERLGVCRKTVYNLRRAGVLVAVVRGVTGGVGILESSLLRALDRRPAVGGA